MLLAATTFLASKALGPERRGALVARPPARALAAASACAAVLLASCGKEPAAPAASGAAAAPQRPNLVLITMDTTRADHLGCYGASFAKTPALDRLAAEGVIFDQAIAVAPLTLPSHVSMMTSLYPPRSGVRDNSDFRLPESDTTLAEHLKAQGYRAEACVGAYVLAGELGLAQGFESYTEPHPASRTAHPDPNAVRVASISERRAFDVVNDALEALGKMKDGPFFLWVHLFDPHFPYDPPKTIRAAFADRPYDGEIAGMDAEIGRLLDQLRAYGLIDRTVVAAVADHGESLGDHGESSHGLFLYDATLHVPLIVRYPPRLSAGTRYAGLVSGVDIAPTLLDLMGLPPLPAAQGRSVAPALTGGSVAEREPVYAESLYGERAYGWSPVFALRSPESKFIDAPEPELYALKGDPGEKANLAGKQAADVESWRGRLASLVRSLGAPDPAAQEAMSEEQRAALRSLGYVSAGAPGLSRRDRPDPKRLVEVSNLFQVAEAAIVGGDTAAAARALKEALARDPGNPAAMSLSGSLRYSSGDRAAGLAQLRAAAAASPGVFENQWNLGNALFLDGKLDEAEKVIRAALAIVPSSGEAHYALANVLARKRAAAQAVPEYQAAIAAGLRTPAVRAALGTALAATGDAAGAEASLRSALEDDPGLADAWNQLGIVLDKTGRRPEAKKAFGSAIAAEPTHADALFNRAKLELLDKELKPARRDLDTLLAAHPDYAAGRFLDAHLCVAEGNTPGAKAALAKFLAASGADPGMAAAARQMLKQLGG